ncbi:DNA ligase [Microbacterium phage Hendrix]|uniref:DNA ligase n=1 Tax=Microbacterium phage Hendrix TaxID=2182341 RepID=A0A2U8UU31_9CAUD|nr:DNA ligase [Microbacterium phage Hendrix]AWN07681.1 DNA ligase [Microbacterium phage Hendrix]
MNSPLPTLKPMKMTDIPVTDAEKYLVDDDWVLEQKHDGARALITAVYEEAPGSEDPRWTFTWQASGGGPLKFAAAAQHMRDIEKSLSEVFLREDVDRVILDGELIVEDGELRLFDVAYLEYNSRNEPDIEPHYFFSQRRAALEELFAHHDYANVKVSHQALTEDEKRRLWAGINYEGVEGGMVKHLDGIYEPGVRTKTQLKLKLVKTADVIVTSVERKFDHKGMVTHGSAGLALRIRPEQDPKPWLSAVTGKRTDAAGHAKMSPARQLAHAFVPREQISVGAASLIGKDLTIDVGDVVEVAYLYWGGEALVQPRILRKRLVEEKPSEDCWLDQIPAYSRRSVGVF